MRPMNLRAAGTSVTAAALAFGLSAAAAAPEATATAPTTAAVNETATPAAPAAAAPRIAVSITDSRLRFGQRLVVTGRVTRGQSGRRIALEYRARGRHWRTVGRTTVGAGGRFRLSARVERNGRVRVVLAASARTTATEAPVAAAAVQTRSRAVLVAADVAVARREIHLLRGGHATVAGVLAPRVAGRLVTLERRVRGSWRRLDSARTGVRGVFRLRITAGRLGSSSLRVRFRGDGSNSPTARGAGTLTSYRESLASWYGIYGGPLACGGRLGYDQIGVANKSLPCGTKVTIRYHGRTVVAPVIDRGPYAGAREWDLTGAVKRRLGFDGVGVVWVTR